MICKISDNDTCLHHIVVQWRPTVFRHKDRLNEQAHFVHIAPEILGNLKLAVAISRHNDSHVDVAVGIGITLGIRAEHHYLRLSLEPRGYDSLVLSDEADGFVAAESSSFIHSVIRLVSSMIYRQVSLESRLWRACLSSG